MRIPLELVAMIQPAASFAENLELMPSIEGLERIELLDQTGEIVANIENQPGKQGSLRLYQYLQLTFGELDAHAAAHGLECFAEHTVDARNRPGAHPNIDRLLDIVDGASPLTIHLVHKD